MMVKIFSKKAQEEKSKIFPKLTFSKTKRAQEERFYLRKSLNLTRQKSGQEEMVGFGLIIIIVAIVLVVFLSISLNNNERETIESYEVESFIQAFLQHTSDCRRADDLEYLSIQKLIFECDSGDLCLDGEDTCEVLNDTLVKIMDDSWKFGADRPIKGRKLDILSNGQEVLFIQEGNITSNSKGARQEFFRSGSEISIEFTVYY